MMRGRTIGMIGLGRIGRNVANRLQGWDVNLIAYDQYVKQKDAPEGVKMVDLDTLYKTSDIVSLFVVVTDETRGMINDHAFSLMKPTAYLINTSRGQVVDEDALIRALKSKRIAGAALDTFNSEPLPADNPLRKFDNLFLTPHMIGHTKECFAVQPESTCTDATSFPNAAVENITNILNGIPSKYCVNPGIIPKWRERIPLMLLVFFVVAITIGYVKKVNTGLVGFVFAIIVALICGLTVKDILAGFPTTVIMALFSVTLFFGFFIQNGIVKWIAQNIEGATFVDVDDMIDEIVAIKSEEELDTLRDVCALHDKVYAALPTIVRP